ncbi:MAG: hypothetical protein WBC85_13695 [Planktotalea sp.]|uniref:CBU_0592 family membrane protein n=1 Tax=Planktotalea sp. TaxID=2029877 RepID=UPI003C752B07
MDYLLEFASPFVIEMIGVSGFVLYVVNYTLLTLRVLNARHVAYFAINLLAASMVLIGLSVSFNLASAMIQLFWIAISIVAITVRVLDGTNYQRKAH